MTCENSQLTHGKLIALKRILDLKWMSESGNRSRVNTGIVVLFLLFLAIHATLILTGTMWLPLSQGPLLFWLILDILAGSTAAGVLLIYSIERYRQEHLFRDLLFVMLSLDALLAAVFYLLTNPAFLGISPFVDRNRNRVTVTFIGLFMALSPLLGSVASDAPVKARERLRILVANGVIAPVLMLYAVFTPVQLIVVSSPGQGPFQFTVQAFVMLVLILAFLIASTIKSFMAWRQGRTSTCLGLTLLLVLLLVASLLVSMLTNPSSVLEVAWVFAWFQGFLLVSIGMVMDVVMNPLRALRGLVESRTSELVESRKESEYYLNIWSHKVGNLLQELSMYLELLTLSSNPEEISRLRESAAALVYDVQAINSQVHVLARIKKRESQELAPVDINSAFHVAIQDVRSRLGARAPEIAVSELHGDDSVLGDDLMGTIPFNIIMYIVRTQEAVKPKVRIKITETGSFITARVEYEGRPVSSDIHASLVDTLDPSRTTLGLDIYSTKLLLKIYGGSLEYEDTPTGGQFDLVLRKAQRPQVVQR
jgi:hypothetical protein